jgi:DNA anti-recombination protein RmuC
VEQLRLQYLEKLAAIEATTEKAHGALSGRTDRMADTMERNLNDLTDHFSLTVDRLETRTEAMNTDAMAQAEHTRRHFGEQMAEMDQVSTQTQKSTDGRAKDMADGIRQVVDQLGQDYTGALDQLQDRTVTMTDTAMASADQIKAHFGRQLTEIEDTSAQINNAIAGQADQMAAGVRDTVTNLGQEIDQTIDRLESRVAGTSERIKVQTDDLRTATTAATEEAVRRRYLRTPAGRGI